MTDGAGLPLSAMLEHPRWDQVVGLTATGVDTRIQTTHLVRDVGSGLAGAGPGALLGVMYSADRNDWRLDSLMNRARVAGVAAVLVEGAAPLRRSTAVLAERLSLPVLGAENVIGAWRVLEQTLIQADVLTARVVLRVVRDCRRAATGVDAVVRAVSSALHRPTVLVDSHGAPLAGTPGAVPATWSEELARALEPENARAPVARPVRLPTGKSVIVCPVQSAGTDAWLVTILTGDLPPEVRAITAALPAAAAAVEQRLAAGRLELERDARQRTTLLTEILQGHTSDEVRRRALGLGWPLDGWHTGIHIGVAAEVDLTGRRSEVSTALEAAGLDAVVVEQRDGFDAWTSSSQEPNPQQIQDQASRLRRAHRQLDATLRAAMGVGRVHRGPDGIGRSLSEASDAARLARGRPESGRFLHVDRLGLAQLLLAWTRTDTFQPAAQALLAPLQQHSHDLLPTLAVYLDCESSVADAAAILGVHRNTVSARIGRIESLLGVDLAVPDERLALHLACRTSIAGLDDTDAGH